MKKFVFILITVLFVLALLTACGTTPSSNIKTGYGVQFVSTQLEQETINV